MRLQGIMRENHSFVEAFISQMVTECLDMSDAKIFVPDKFLMNRLTVGENGIGVSIEDSTEVPFTATAHRQIQMAFSDHL
jgi:hypothetical protein